MFIVLRDFARGGVWGVSHPRPTFFTCRHFVGISGNPAMEKKIKKEREKQGKKHKNNKKISGAGSASEERYFGT